VTVNEGVSAAGIEVDMLRMADVEMNCLSRELVSL